MLRASPKWTIQEVLIQVCDNKGLDHSKFDIRHPGINVLRTAFTLVDPKSVKIQWSHQYLFMLLGSTSVRWMLMKLSPGINFINILHAAFAHAEPLSVKNTIFRDLSSQKLHMNMLVKLTPGIIFINILCLPFSYQSVLHYFSLFEVWLCTFLGIRG